MLNGHLQLICASYAIHTNCMLTKLNYCWYFNADLVVPIGRNWLDFYDRSSKITSDQ